MKQSSALDLGAMSRSRTNSVAKIREDFLNSGSVGDQNLVNDVIKASWVRSQQLQLNTDTIDPCYRSAFNEQTPLALSAEPVLRQLSEELANEPVGIVLTDARGVVLKRVCTDSGLTSALNAACLAPGFSYAEEHVGTNGIGTALESRAPTVVNGVEHYSSGLGAFTCAGVPIVHPLNGALLGVLDVTSLRKDSNPLLLVIAKSTAHRIQQQLLWQANALQLALFTDYLAACKRGGESIVAVNQDMIMMNTHTRQHFDAEDRTALLARVPDASGSIRPLTMLEDLPSGITARIEYRPAFAGDTLAGGVLRIQESASPLRLPKKTGPDVQLPGVVGTSPTWKRVYGTILDSQRRGEWLVLEGEAGVGKLALLRGVHQLKTPSGQFSVIDAPTEEQVEEWMNDVSEKLANGAGIVVFRRAHELPSRAIQELSELLLEYAAHHADDERPWITMTMLSSPRNAFVEAELLPHFPHSVEIPPLRHHLNDLRELVPHLLGKPQRANPVALAPAAMNQLMRLPWLGNVSQLIQVLNRVTRLHRNGLIQIDDLPAECRATGRRKLSHLESLERDAIAKSLALHQGNKDHAAEDLGMSRATIYRRIREYGIVWTEARDGMGPD